MFFLCGFRVFLHPITDVTFLMCVNSFFADFCTLKLGLTKKLDTEPFPEKKCRIVSSVADPGCLSRIPHFSIPEPNCLHPGSQIRIKEFKYFNLKKPKKWFPSSRKYDPGCSSQIPDPDADFLPILDPESRGQKGTGSRIPDLDLRH
jgi:hypothetical protein